MVAVQSWSSLRLILLVPEGWIRLQGWLLGAQGGRLNTDREKRQVVKGSHTLVGASLLDLADDTGLRVALAQRWLHSLLYLLPSRLCRCVLLWRFLFCMEIP